MAFKHTAGDGASLDSGVESRKALKRKLASLQIEPIKRIYEFFSKKILVVDEKKLQRDLLQN